jgi:hypothetical protein
LACASAGWVLRKSSTRDVTASACSGVKHASSSTRSTCIHQRMSAYVSMRWCETRVQLHAQHLHTSAYVSIHQHTSACAGVKHASSSTRSTCIRQHTSAYVSMRQHTSAYVRIRQHTSPLRAETEAQWPARRESSRLRRRGLRANCYAYAYV